MKKKNEEPIRSYVREVSNYSLSDGCFYCKAPAVAWDHVVPRILGGKSNIENLVPVCTRCNSSKGKKSLSKFRLFLKARGQLADFDTPDPRPIQGQMTVFSGNDIIFESFDGTIKINDFHELFKRIYVNDK